MDRYAAVKAIDDSGSWLVIDLESGDGFWKSCATREEAISDAERMNKDERKRNAANQMYDALILAIEAHDDLFGQACGSSLFTQSGKMVSLSKQNSAYDAAFKAIGSVKTASRNRKQVSL